MDHVAHCFSADVLKERQKLWRLVSAPCYQTILKVYCSE